MSRAIICVLSISFSLLASYAVSAQLIPSAIIPLGGGANGGGVYDTTINLDDYAQADQAAAIAAVLRPYLTGAQADVSPRINIKGKAYLNPTSTHQALYRNIDAGTTNNLPYRTFIDLCPSDHFSGDFPIADGAENTRNSQGVINFDNVEVEMTSGVACTNQTLMQVFLHAGCQWANGTDTDATADHYGGTITRMPALTGAIFAHNDQDCDVNGAGAGDDITVGEPLVRASDTPFVSGTVSAVVWADGGSRAKANNLTINYVQNTTIDYDNIVVWQDDTGQWEYGPITSTNAGIGVLISGAAQTSFQSPSLLNGSIGWQFGDPTTGGNSRYFSSCVGSTDTTTPGFCSNVSKTTGAIHINGGSTENTAGVGLVMFSGGTDNIFKHWIEFGNPLTDHMVLLGAGTCAAPATTRLGLTCGQASDCTAGGGSCSYPTGNHSVGEVTFNGNISGEKDNGAYAALMIGGGATGSSDIIKINGSLGNSNVSGLAVGFEYAATLSTGPLANMPIVDVTNANRTASFYWPDYPKLVHDGALTIPFRIATADGGFAPADDVVNYIPLCTWAGTAGIAPTDPCAWVPLPSQSIWQIMRVFATNPAALNGGSAQTCDLLPVLAKADMTTSRTAVTVGSNTTRVVAGATLDTIYGSIFPHASTLASPPPRSAATGFLALKATAGGGTCDHLNLSGGIVLFPL